METSRQRGTYKRIRCLLIVVIVVAAIAQRGAGGGPASAAGAASSQAAPPAWCQWVPPELLPPECRPVAGAGFEVEDHFEATGTWAVTSRTASAPGTPGVTVFHPRDLGAGGYRHPIITWGNGTGNTCQTYQQMLSHYASWGYVVVCPNTGSTGSGAEIWAAARWMREQNGVSGSVFAGRLNTSKVGAAGGSQGASGAVNAEILSGGVITSTIGVALVDPYLHIWGAPPDFSRVRAPTFLLSGANDWLTSQAQQTTYYNQIPGAAAKAASIGTDHNTINQPGHGLGYTTAWFKYTLEGDALARRAFVNSSPPELNTNTGYSNQAEKGLR